MELQQALFFDLGCSVLKLPTSVINALHVDEIGQVWFFISKPMQNINEFEKEFRSRLDFYKKGKSFYLHLTGRSCIVNDPEEINCIIGLADEYKQQANGKMVLVKLKIEEIHYYPFKAVPNKNQALASAPLKGGAMDELKHLATKEAPGWVRAKQGKFAAYPSAFVKTLQYIVKDIIPVFQSH